MNPNTTQRQIKARNVNEVRRLEDIPNVGPSIAADLRSLGIDTPDDVAQMNPWVAYDQLRTPLGTRHDPCVLDVFLAAKDFMNGGSAQPWWNFTAQRKESFCCPSTNSAPNPDALARAG